MEKKLTQLEGCEKQIEITLNKSEIKPFIDKAYLETAPKVDIKGFRKGKVPHSVIRMHFGKQIEFDAKQDASNDYFQKIIKEEKIHIVSQPVLKDVVEDGDNTTFIISFETFPEFELGEYRGLNIEEPIHRVTEEEVDHELLHIQINSGEIKDAEAVAGDLYIVNINYRNTDEAGLPLIDAEPKETQLFLHNHEIYPALREMFMNLKVGDSFNYLPAPNDVFPPNQMVNITINEIKEVVPKALDDAFATEYSGGKFQTLEDLKTELQFEIQEQWDNRSREQMEVQIIDQLSDMHDFTNPPSLVDQVALEMAEDIKKQYEFAKHIDSSIIAKDILPQAEKRVKWEIIKTKLCEKEDIKLEDFDIDNWVETSFSKFGMPKDALRNAAERNERVREDILNKKVMDLILDFAVTSETDFGNDIHSHDHNHDHDHDHNHDHDHDHNHDHDEESK